MFYFSLCSIISLFGQTELWDDYLENNINNGLQKVKVAQGTPLAVRRSEDGYDFPTKGAYRVLTIFINIIYDGSYSVYNPNINNSWWAVNNTEGVNLLQPTQYFNDVFDVNNSKPRTGYFTRY